MFEYLVDSLWSPTTALKFLLIFVTYPIWLPVLQVMWKETKGAFTVMDLRSGDTRQVVNRPAGEDPWLTIPRASRRRGGFASRSAPPPSSAPAPRGSAPARSTRRTGF